MKDYWTILTNTNLYTKSFNDIMLFHVEIRLLKIWDRIYQRDLIQVLTLSGPTSGDFSRIQSKIHASDKNTLRFILVRSMSGPERVKSMVNISE